MKKLTFSILIIFILIGTLAGCSWPSKSKAQGIAYDFLMKYFNYSETERIVDVDSYNKLYSEHTKKFKALMTSKAYEAFVENNTPKKVFDVAAKGRTLLEFDNINLVIKEEYHQEKTLYFEYSGDLIIDSVVPVENQVQQIRLYGEIILIREGNTYKISHFILRETQDWFRFKDTFGDKLDG